MFHIAWKPESYHCLINETLSHNYRVRQLTPRVVHQCESFSCDNNLESKRVAIYTDRIVQYGARHIVDLA